MRLASRAVRRGCQPVFLFGVALVLFGLGCAARLQSPRGDTFIVGFTRGSTSLRTEEGMILAHDTGSGAPLEIGLVPYGFEIGLGMITHAEDIVIEPEWEGEFLPRKSLAVPLGAGEEAWRFGLERYRIPRKGARIRARVNTVAGLALRMAHQEPFIRAGFSRTTITEVRETGEFTKAEFFVNGTKGEARISTERTKE